MHANRFDPLEEILDAADYMSARAISREKFAVLVRESGSAEGALAVLRERRIKRRARTQAERIGLAYWPALIKKPWVPQVDPRAYLAAERVLARRHGLWGDTLADGGMGRGGWDMMGHHGLSPRRVAQMWFAAGCRDTEKFRAQVALGTVARKGDSIPFLRNYARGQRWIDAWGVGTPLSRKAIAALGRLSPELRHAAVSGLSEFKGYRHTPTDRHRPIPFRVADLNWAHVARIQGLRADPSARAKAIRALALPARPAAVVLGREHSRGMPHPIQDADVPDLCPSYPTVRRDIAVRIVAGESPVALARGTLTRREAHEWLSAGGPVSAADIPASVCAWITREVPVDGHLPRDPQVARWLAHVHQRGSWSGMTRVERHPDGHALRRLDMIDEITPEDLDRGISTGVERAFDRAAERLSKVDAEDHRTICRNPFGRLPRAMAVLTSPAALAAEGKALGHCVGGYSRAVERGQCLILSIASWHGRSTVELRPGAQWTVAQHYGPHNGSAPRRHQQLLRAWLARINTTRARCAA